MAVKGAQAKLDITQKILDTFEGSFVYEKEIRIPYTEDGVPGQIKVVLTAAKNMVGNEEDAVVANIKPSIPAENVPQEPSTEEKERLKTLLDRLGL